MVQLSGTFALVPKLLQSHRIIYQLRLKMERRDNLAYQTSVRHSKVATEVLAPASGHSGWIQSRRRWYRCYTATYASTFMSFQLCHMVASVKALSPRHPTFCHLSDVCDKVLAL